MSAMHHHAAADFARTVQAERVGAAARRRPPADDGELAPLVTAAAAGDESAWAVLVARFGPHLIRVARAHGLSRHEAEDAVQDTWVRLFRNIGGVRDPRALAGWLTTTARHEALRQRQRGQRERPTDEELRADLEDTEQAEIDAALDAASRRRAVVRALESLSPRHQRLMRALFAEVVPSYSDLAAELGMPVGSIGPIRGRCLAQLRLDGALRQAVQ